MRSSTSLISTTAGSSTPARSGLPTPTSASDPIGQGSPEENGKDKDKEAGHNNYYECTVNISKFFSLLLPSFSRHIRMMTLIRDNEQQQLKKQ
jgi:hypothetical protein